MSRSEDRPKCIRAGKQHTLRAEHNGQMLTANELAPLVGLAPRTIRERISTGRPVTRIGRKNYGAEHWYDGEMRKAEEIASMVGCTVGLVNYRVKHGIPLDTPVTRKQRRPAAQSLLESGERRIGYGAGDNGLYYDDDAEAKAWHKHCCGGVYGECTLDDIGRLWGMSRERVRQIAETAYAKIRKQAQNGEKDAVEALEYFRERAEQRRRAKLSHWEQAELNSPGSFL